MFAADPKIRKEHEAGVVQYGAVAFFHAVEFGGQVGILADVKTRDAFVAIRIVVVRGGVVAVFYVEERVVHGRKIARNDERCNTRFVGLKSDGDDVAHQPRMIAQIFGQAIGGPVHGGGDGVFGFCRVFGVVFAFAHALDALFYFAHAGQIFIQLAFVGGADLPSESPARGL